MEPLRPGAQVDYAKLSKGTSAMENHNVDIKITADIKPWDAGPIAPYVSPAPDPDKYPWDRPHNCPSGSPPTSLQAGTASHVHVPCVKIFSSQGMIDMSGDPILPGRPAQLQIMTMEQPTMHQMMGTVVSDTIRAEGCVTSVEPVFVNDVVYYRVTISSVSYQDVREAGRTPMPKGMTRPTPPPPLPAAPRPVTVIPLRPNTEAIVPVIPEEPNRARAVRKVSL